jgi:tetratricopeptide (TPR) repeat protein
MPNDLRDEVRTLTANGREGAVGFSTLLVPVLLAACSAPAQKPAETARAQLKDSQLLVERGRAYGELGDYTRAEQYLGAALSAGARPDAVLPHLLSACVGAGHLRLASEYAEQQLARDPANAHLRFLTGALHAQLGNRATARHHLEQAAAELPNDPNVQFSVATFFRDDLHDRVDADPYFRGYLNLAPKGEHANEAEASLMERVR